MKLYPIPGSMGYCTSESGKVYDSSLKECELYLTSDGYLHTTIKRADGSLWPMRVHRLVLMSQDVVPDNHTELTVNHLDMDKTNNRKSNLEWATHQENNVHSTLFRTDLKRPLILATTPEGKYRYFDNIPHVSLDLDLKPKEVWLSIKDDRPIDGWSFKHIRFDAAIPKELQKARRSIGAGVGTLPKKEVMVLDTDNGDVVTYPSLREAGIAFETSASHLHQSINRHDLTILKLFRKRYVVAYSDKGIPSFTEEMLDKARSRGQREVVVFVKESRALEIYRSAVEFYKRYNLSKKTVTTLLKKGGVSELHGLVFTYLNGRSPDLIKAHMERPGEMCV